MSFFMIIFLASLIYVSYFKIVFLLFRGRQHNRFFAAVINTLVPVVGSVPVFVMASKYELKVKSLASKMDDYVLRCVIIGLHLLSVFMMFLPFFSSEGATATGVNIIFGFNIGGESVFKSAEFLMYLIVLPIVAAIVDAIDTKLNIRNVLSYISAIIQALTIFAIAIYAESIESMSSTFFLWFYCIIQVGVMLLSFYSLINVRNAFLLDLEKKENSGSADGAAESEKRVEDALDISDNTYKCSKCGKQVVKGSICSCRRDGGTDENSNFSLKQGYIRGAGFCGYCGRRLAPGANCSCNGSVNNETERAKVRDERKCKYCGQILVGDSTCVCEKIMKNSAPVAEKADPGKAFPKYDAVQAVSNQVSEELSDLEKMIEERFSHVKSAFSISENDNK